MKDFNGHYQMQVCAQIPEKLVISLTLLFPTSQIFIHASQD
uniref:Uncharacterized protein n=1 Tax=Arundo donax TaxID=35708 RepID=A0A0A9ATE9_ARUDO